MNEQIKKLVEQANLQPHSNAQKAAIEKFAELIIQKCIEEAGDPADGLILDDTWHDGVRASIWSIKQYFGVK